MLPSILRLQRRLHWATCLRAQGRRQPREDRNGAWGGKGRQSFSETPGKSNSCVGGGRHSGWAEMEPSQDRAQHYRGATTGGRASCCPHVTMDGVRTGRHPLCFVSPWMG